MKRFVVHILLFVAYVLFILFFAEICISKYLRKTEKRLYNGWNYIYNDTTNHDVIICGSSRAWRQYNPIIIDTILGVNSYNLGIDGSPLYRQLIKLDRYIEHHGIPKYVIQNIDFFSLAPYVEYEREQFYPYLFVDRNLTKQLDFFEHLSFADKYIPLYRYIGFNDIVLKHLLFKDRLEKGYLSNEKTWDGTQFFQVDQQIAPIDDVVITKFKEKLDFLHYNGSKVLFVYAPVYDGTVEKYSNIGDFLAIIQSIADEYEIPILKYYDIPMCYDTAYFYNATHLNKTGAELFTTKLAHDIDSIGFLK